MKLAKTMDIEKTKQKSVQNEYDNALAVMSNTLARAQTHWNAEETKIMLYAVSQFNKRDKDNWISLNKADLMQKLGYGDNFTYLRNRAISMMKKAIISFDGPTSAIWDDGFMFTRVKSTRKLLKIRFNDGYDELLEQLTSHFTEYYLDNLMDLQSKHALSLYMYLSSWFNSNVFEQHTELYKNDLKSIFNLSDNDYWRNYGTDKAKFHWSDFEKYCLNKAIDEINNSNKCDIRITNCIKLKKHAMVTGYEIIWAPLNPETRKWAYKSPLDAQMTIDDYI